MNASEELSTAQRGFVIAPAGCGKTHLIAEAVTKYPTGRELILTHTHAGVDALRKRLKYMHAVQGSYHIDTIAGWALRYASSFPVTSGISTDMPCGGEWDQVYDAANSVISTTPVASVVGDSYTGVYVDEYQDCTTEQHKLILSLAEILPCRILGDPLQGIFGFGDNTLVDWEKDVISRFNRLKNLDIPWRWEQANKDLGKWLMIVREKIRAGEAIDLTDAPVKWIELPEGSQIEQIKACYSALRHQNETTVAIHHMPSMCQSVAKKMKGTFSCIESMDCEDLIQWAEKIGSSDGTDRAAILIGFASKCMTKIGSELKTASKAFSKGQIPAVRKHKQEVDAIARVCEPNAHVAMSDALDCMCKMKDAHVYRHELLAEMHNAITEYETGKHENLQCAAWHARERTRRIGRWLGKRVIGTTRLVKGLEFDNAILLDADILDAKNLYVAMTRGARSLTILSREPVLRPSS